MKKAILICNALLVSTVSMALPNPSWVYCLQQGGSYETRVDSEGNQDGVCLFNQEGMLSECGGWAYFRGDCAPGDCARWSVDTQNCEIMMTNR